MVKLYLLWAEKKDEKQSLFTLKLELNDYIDLIKTKNMN